MTCQLTLSWPLSIDLEQPRGAHAATDAHRYYTVAGPTALPLQQHVPNHPCATHTIRVSHGNSAARYIQPLVGNPETIATIEHLACERLIELPYAHVLDP